MQEAFGGINYVDRPNIGICKICDDGILFDEDMTVDQIKIHKRCFKCGICDYPLQIGYCARDPALEGRYGLYWYCNLEHMLWGPGRKAAELDKLKRGKKHQPLSPTSGAPLGSPTGGAPLGSPTGDTPVGGAGNTIGAPSGPISMLDAIAARRAAGDGGAHAASQGGAGGVGGAGAGPEGGFGGQGGVGQGVGGAGDQAFGESGGAGAGGVAGGAVGSQAGGAGGGAGGVAGGVAGGAAGQVGTVIGGTGGAFGTGNDSAGSCGKIVSEQTPTVGKCKVCDQPIAMCDDITVDRITIHRNCFKCGICDSKLFPGSCARDQSLEAKYGLKWYCGIHMLLGPGKKTEEMDKAGKPKRF